MTTLSRWGSVLLAGSLFATLFIAGCTVPLSSSEPKVDSDSVWTGRISLQAHSEPPQAFFAGFELRGNPARGELTLSTPIGTNLAVLRWSPQEAVLDSGTQVQRFATVDELIEKVTGAAIPLPALFDWLAGKNTALDGWSADLSQHAQGRISASRNEPPPRTDLRIVLAR